MVIAASSPRAGQLRENRREVTVTVARPEIRKWLRESTEGKTVEEVLGSLLAGTGDSRPSGN